ncbi:MAG: hypothetical protein WKF47_13240 [Geodermatophilaceae bacterium]|jgi:hypothetical protein
MLDTLAILAALLGLLGAPAVGVLIAVNAPRRQAARRAVADVITTRPSAIAITDARTGTDHLVTDAAAARGLSSGLYLAVCRRPGARGLPHRPRGRYVQVLLDISLPPGTPSSN